MKLTRLLSALLVLGLVAPFGLRAMAYDKGGVPSANTLQQVGVSAEQQKAIEGLRTQARQQEEPLHEELRQKYHALSQYLGSRNANEPEAARLQQEINRLHEQMETMQLKTWFQVRKHLTPEQAQKVVSMHEERMEQMREHHHNHMQGQGSRSGAMRPQTEGRMMRSADNNASYSSGSRSYSDNGSDSSSSSSRSEGDTTERQMENGADQSTTGTDRN